MYFTFNANAQNKVVTYFKNGKIKTTSFKNAKGINSGKWIYYRENGYKNLELIFNDEGKPESNFVMYFSNGKVQTKGT